MSLTGLAEGNLGDLLRLDGRVAIVTGAGRRIGREIARVLASQGARVAIGEIDAAVGDRAADEIEAEGGIAFAHPTDVGRSEQVASLVDATVARFGRLDILINNAHWEKVGSVVELDEADWDRSFDVLLKALYLGCKYAIPHMEAAGGGAIVNISSVHARHVSDRYVTYQTAKAAVVHFTRQVAWDFGPARIRVNCICPGAIPSAEEHDRTMADEVRRAEATMLKALKRAGHPRDIARAVLYLVSDLSDWVTGQTLTVDGGEFMTFPSTGARRMADYLADHPDRRGSV